MTYIGKLIGQRQALNQVAIPAFAKHSPALLHGTQIMAVMNAYAYMSAGDWAVQMHLLNAELERRLERKQLIGKENQPVF